MPEITQNESKFSKDEAYYVLKRTEKEPSIFQPDNFDTIKDYLLSCPAAKDLPTRIIVEEDAIYFGHSLKEIAAAFPGLPNYIMGRISKSFSEDNIFSYGYKTPDVRLEFVNPITKQQKILKTEAREFFSDFQKRPSSKITYNKEHADQPQDILLDLLSDHETVAIGELHHHRSSKKLLIDNMALLKQSGVDAIYLEHVFYDTQKELFDDYFKSDSLELPPILKSYLGWLDRGFGVTGRDFSPYSFTGLVVQAKRYGIRIIPVDTVASYSTGSALHIGTRGEKDPADRCLMMNHVAAKVYESEKNTHNKAIFFVGSNHINDLNSGIPGITEITGAPTLVVEDNDETKQMLTTDKHPAHPDMLVYMDTDLSEEAKQLQEAYALDLEKQSIRSVIDRKTSQNINTFNQADAKGNSLKNSKEIKKLEQAIENLKQYGTSLRKKSPEKSNAAITLSSQLKDKLNKFIENGNEKTMTAWSFLLFRKEFKTKLHSQDKLFAHHRAYHRVIIANVAIALTGVGTLALLGKFLYSLATEKKAVGFFDKTNGQQSIKKIESTLENLDASRSSMM
jgi:hypothetical protein